MNTKLTQFKAVLCSTKPKETAGFKGIVWILQVFSLMKNNNCKHHYYFGIAITSCQFSKPNEWYHWYAHSRTVKSIWALYGHARRSQTYILYVRMDSNVCACVCVRLAMSGGIRLSFSCGAANASCSYWCVRHTHTIKRCTPAQQLPA